ncbi:MAG: hypothetical protein IKT40_12185 [Bacilli bacterium]|nr:hypothetical protein [Bacilli bacterium]
MSKLILDKKPNFPLGVSYKDIDDTFKEWVENDLNIAYDGKRLPTLKLFANQRLNEYLQTWKHVDEFGNLLMNFKTITRENNPKKGSSQGESYNIPGDRDYPMFIVPTILENGEEAYDMYTMKQPFSIDMYYSVSIITNKYELINKMNELVNYKFKSINCYIAPNNHYMPMTLENISDESEYSIDDMKYYEQTYEIRIKAYIIREEDFKITHLPYRVKGKVVGLEDSKKRPTIQIEEKDVDKNCCDIKIDDDRYYNKILILTINFPTCADKAEFEIDTDFVIRQIETTNVYDFIMFVNEEKQTFDNETKLYEGDTIKIKISRDDSLEESSISISGFAPSVFIDKNYNPESSLDEQIDTEEIIYNT